MLDYGQCYVSVQDRLLYVPMHKNMTASMRSVMTEKQWQLTNFIKNTRMFDELMPRLTVFCIVRDPWERWNSAMCQYWYGHDLAEITKEALMDVRLDHHSDRQVDYVKGFDPTDNFLRFEMGDPELAKLLDLEALPKRNMSKYRDQKVFIQRRIDEIMDDELKQRVLDYYEADYRFITHGVLPK
jgi:hypothetical protein